MRGHWPRGRRRNDVDAARMWRALCESRGAREIARIVGVSDRTVRRWASGEDWCRGDEQIMRILDRLFPLARASGPIYEPSLAIDGHTRVAGVGEYSRRAARGWPCSYGDDEMNGTWTIKTIDDIRRELVKCEDQARVHISRECICERFAFRGVPARSVDVLIDTRILTHSEGYATALVLERSRKAGKYDGRERDRWLVRAMRPANVEQMQLQQAECLLGVSSRLLIVRVLVGGSVASAADYERLPAIDSRYDQLRCVKRNWTRYFRHLDWDTQVAPRLDEFPRLDVDERTTVNEVNIRASRWLADLSYSLGWHRVIHEAARRNGLPLWVQDDHTERVAREDELHAVQDALETSQS